MAQISTHVLDIAKGLPAAGVPVELRFDGAVIFSAVTNADGRTDRALLTGDVITPGRYELIFRVAGYFDDSKTPGIPFLDEIVLHFGVSDARGNYHVPLLVAPHGYSTYRGS
jgi:5-hydroxyisourate hydrolase